MRINKNCSVLGAFTHDSKFEFQENTKSIDLEAETIQNDLNISEQNLVSTQMEQEDPSWKENLAKCRAIRDRIHSKRGQSLAIKPNNEKTDWKENLAKCQAILDRIKNRRSN